MRLAGSAARAGALALLLLGTSPSAVMAFSLKPTLAEIGGGVFRAGDPRFQYFYLEQVPLSRLTVGWFLHRTVSVSFSGGYLYAAGYGLQPGQSILTCQRNCLRTQDLYTLRTAPIQADLRLYLDFLRNQWVVPFGSAGAEEILGQSRHRELKRERFSFEKRGWHYGGGLLVLLDVFDKYHADKLEDEWGVADTYIGLEGRKGTVDDFGKKEGLDFSGWTYVASFTFRLVP
ncbi:MAG: hypothetical protein HYY13_04710 [Nitrospirae bacterium]|nr:hypothetical protein [Nitrospirota bacterium]